MSTGTLESRCLAFPARLLLQNQGPWFSARPARQNLRGRWGTQTGGSSSEDEAVALILRHAYGHVLLLEGAESGEDPEPEEERPEREDGWLRAPNCWTVITYLFHL